MIGIESRKVKTVADGVNSILIPRIIHSSSQSQAVQRGGDLHVREFAGHLGNHVNCIKVRAMAMLARLALLETKFRVTTTRPVNQENDLSLLFINVGDYFAYQGPCNSLL